MYNLSEIQVFYVKKEVLSCSLYSVTFFRLENNELREREQYKSKNNFFL